MSFFDRAQQVGVTYFVQIGIPYAAIVNVVLTCFFKTALHPGIIIKKVLIVNLDPY